MSNTNTRWYERGHVRYARDPLIGLWRVLASFGYLTLVIGLVAFTIYTATHPAYPADAAGAVGIFALMGVMAIIADPPRHALAWLFDTRR